MSKVVFYIYIRTIRNLNVMAYDANKHELEILEFWKKNNIFEKSVEQRPEDKPYVFYDGPPFATGLPHYGHIMAGTKKDAVPRYKTMRGYRVERRWGWDCHGLPIENLIEKELGLPGKKEIEEYGVDKFNEACRDKVLEYAGEWKKIIPRLGRWVDMDNPYKTMDRSFMESEWWVFKSLFDRGLIYEGKRPMHICPRCVTPLSNFEVSQGYKDVKDMSVTAKFRVLSSGLGVGGDVHLLAWTTTPWTLPGNILVAVGADLEYSLVSFEGAHYVVAKDLLMRVFEGKEFEVVRQVRGADLVGITYEPLFPYYANVEGADNGFRVVAADFVTTDNGTGLVHLAPAFGTDDYEVFKKENVPFIQHVGMDGLFMPEVTDFVGMHVKPADDHMKTDIEIVKWLAHNGKLFAKKKYEHSYPHCWRCDTPLLNYATSSWFVKVTDLKDELLANNEKIHWEPHHVKRGRFGKWLEGVRDWSISRARFWGTPLPIWRSEDGDIVCVGSVEELEQLTGEQVPDLHKHKIDHLTFEKDGKTYARIPDVLDTWFDSGSVPYGQAHYPFENKEKFEKEFPADFIAESQDQTRGWFYTLHVLATALTRTENAAIPVGEGLPAFSNVSVNGMVLAEDGKKMSKRLKNYPDPMKMVDAYGADAVRLYLLSSPVMRGESLNFSEVGLREVYNKVVNTLWNVVTFYGMFAKSEAQDLESGPASDHVLDQWILIRLQQTVNEVTEGLEAYRLHEASRPIREFVDDLSTWYVRRSRDRFKGGDAADKQAALATLRHVLLVLSKLMAPFTPFIAEKTYKEVGGELESVHLESWPDAGKNVMDEEIIEDMKSVRHVVELALSARKESKIRVRQPLQTLEVLAPFSRDELLPLIEKEVNVKEVILKGSEVDKRDGQVGWMVKGDERVKIALSVNIDDELRKEGLVREIVRAVNQKRKEQKLTRNDRIIVEWQTDDALLKSVFDEFGEELKKTVLADELSVGDGDEVGLNGITLKLAVKKV